MLGDGSSISLSDLLPPSASANASTSSSRIRTPTFALIGDAPSSSLFHLALNHVQGHDEDESAPPSSDPTLSEKAKGKQRAPDQDDPGSNSRDEDTRTPDESERHAQELERHVLVLTADLAGLRQKLVAEKDLSLFGHKRDADRVRLLQHITFKSLPHSAQLIYFLASHYGHEHEAASELYTAYAAGAHPPREDPSCLQHAPTMVILHCPSTYLEESHYQDAGIEAYALLLARFLSSFSSRLQAPPLLVLFEPRADEISLPIIPPRLRTSRKRKQPTQDETDHATADLETRQRDRQEEPVDKLSLRVAISRFFECIANVVSVPLSPEDLDYDHLQRWRIDAKTTNSADDTFLEFTTKRVLDQDEDEDESGTLITIEN
ncbi:uncharacterized protein JCM15063_002967 [Sporobolomyces koalae]|uniref:uncharacterized protein n=1 Tax=Sporobolomyces koalae TaxID=500713 RepID=UPI00317A05A5